MTSANLLPFALLICSVSAFAQQQNSTPASPVANSDQEKLAWKLSFDPSTNLVANHSLLRFLPPTDPMSLASNEQIAADTVCYKIRSYVVARDSKNSDSVHLVGYSTCPPADRLRLRTTEARPLSLNH